MSAADLEGEQEVDLGRYGSALAARWWLPLAGLILGAVLGFLLSVGGKQTYSAQAVLYPGTPYSPSGGNAIQSPQTNPASIRAIVKSEATLRRVSADVGLPLGKLRSGTSANVVGGAVPKTGQVPLYSITVQGGQPVKIARAANELARIAVAGVSAGYVDTKIASLQAQVTSDQQQLAFMDKEVARIEATLPRVGASDRIAAAALVLAAQQRRAVVQQDLLAVRPLLTQAQTVERGRILTRAVASKATARSRRNSIVVAALIGLILGALAALAWDRVAARVEPIPAA
ncbi:MAG TPA: Wzz/FepE/Etk N-terminal domain-containing protein [Gaiellaceae bacterium]|jgi:uncharacterized protein involved in exopolysaccharide biosynthesis